MKYLRISVTSTVSRFHHVHSNRVGTRRNLSGPCHRSLEMDEDGDEKIDIHEFVSFCTSRLSAREQCSKAQTGGFWDQGGIYRSKATGRPMCR